MLDSIAPLYLASSSPRRRKLLTLLNVPFYSFSVDTPEIVFPGESPQSAVIRLSCEKMNEAKAIHSNGTIITADTVVAIDGKILGKPMDKDDAFRMLKTLSGETHVVYTGLSVYNKAGRQLNDFVATKVTFRNLQDQEIKDYIAAGSPMDKAGGYGIQDDYGAVFIEKIDGCYYNVVGLPLSRLYLMLKEISGEQKS